MLWGFVGALAGAIHGTVNFAIVEPYLDEAIGIENQNLFDSGQKEDTAVPKITPATTCPLFCQIL